MNRFVALLCSLLATIASAFTVLPVDGLWSIDSERNLSIGRAFTLETTGKTMVVTFYNYTTSGAPTFYTAAGALESNNRVNATLYEPRGGTCLGCTPTSGQLLSTPGQIRFEFTNSVSGYVTLPGESRKAISKGSLAWPTSLAGMLGVWTFSWVYDSLGMFSDLVNLTFVGSDGESPELAYSSDNRIACGMYSRGSLAGLILCIKVTELGALDKSATTRWWGHRMDGVWSSSGLTSTHAFTATRILTANGDQEVLKGDAQTPRVSLVALKAAFSTAQAEVEKHLRDFDR